MPDAISHLVPSGTPPQTFHDEKPFFYDLFLLLHLYAMAKLVSEPLLMILGSLDDGVALGSTPKPRAHTNTDPSSPLLSSDTPAPSTGVTSQGEGCLDDSNDKNLFHIE